MGSYRKKSLITGIAGFVGSHLAELLLNKDHVVYGLVRHRSRLENIEHIKDKLKLSYADILDAHSINEAVNESKPDYIFHLAGQSYVFQSFKVPANTIETNVGGTINLLEAVRKYKPNTKIQIAGSSEEYGLVKASEIPIKEENPLRPVSPYGVSKVAEDLSSVQYYHSYGLETIVTRAFNHTGPRRGDVFVCSDFSKQIVLIEKGKKEPIIYVGNLQAERDFTDVRDMVKAYLLAVEKGKAGEQYNICSGKTHSIKEVLDMLIDMSKHKNIKIKKDPRKMRPSDVPLLLGDCTKFKKQTGWEPEISFEQTLKDLMEYWRENI